MSSARIVRLVTAREFLDRLRNKAFLISTLVSVLALFGAIVVPGLLRDDGPQRFELGLVGSVPASFEETVATTTAAQGAEVALVDLADREAAADSVREGDVDAALIDGRELMAEGGPNPALSGAVDAALAQAETAARLEAAGLSEEEAAGVLAPREPVTVVNPAGTEESGFLGMLVAVAASVLLFLAIQINAQSLLTGAIEEKSSRVVEVLLGTVRPWQLLAAKIIAVTGLALGQIALLIAAALGANAIVGTLALPPATTATVVTVLVMTVIGFVFYAALYTVAGSLASSVEDAQGTAGPLGFGVAAAYFLVIFAVIPSPRGLISEVLTYLPPTAPFTVPARVALDAIPLWQVVVASVITLLGSVVSVRLAGRLYASSLLAGGKLTWRGAWRAEPIR